MDVATWDATSVAIALTLCDKTDHIMRALYALCITQYYVVYSSYNSLQ